MLGAAVVLAAFALGIQWPGVHPAKEPSVRSVGPPLAAGHTYEFHATDHQVFLIDQTNGFVFRYFMNRDDKGKPSTEGFVQLGFLNFSDTQQSVAPSNAPQSDQGKWTPPPSDAIELEPDTALKNQKSPAPKSRP